MGFLHEEICDKHLREGYTQVYYGSFCPDCDERYRLKNQDFIGEEDEYNE